MSDQDIQAIKELRKRDAEAAKSGDFETLRSIMSDDAVMLPPGGKRLEGKTSIDEVFMDMSNAHKEYEILEYIIDLSEPEIAGNLAFEYGEIRGTTRNLETDTIERSNYHVMRILRKEENEEWKVYRTTWTSSDPSSI